MANPLIKVKLNSGAPLIVRANLIEGLTLEHESVVLIMTSGARHHIDNKLKDVLLAMKEADKDFIAEVAKDAAPIEEQQQARKKALADQMKNREDADSLDLADVLG